MARPSARVRIASVAIALVGVVVPACGKKPAAPRTATAPDTTVSAGPDLSTPAAALEAVSRALDAGDYDALRACTTPEGLAGVDRDLAAWRSILTDPSTAPRASGRVPAPEDDAEKERYGRAFRGDAAALLHLLAKTVRSVSGPAADSTAGAAAPASVATPPSGVVRVEVERVRAGGTRGRVVLVARDGIWLADRIQL